jgi:hypothetical protein
VPVLVPCALVATSRYRYVVPAVSPDSVALTGTADDPEPALAGAEIEPNDAVVPYSKT